MTSLGGLRRLVQTLLLAALPLGLGFCAAGVGDSCVLDQHCEGNVAITCEPPCAEIGCHWTSNAQDCVESGQVCVELGERHLPLCALSKEPDARCNTQTHFCDGDKVVSCSGGYAVRVTDCAAQGLTCANVAPGSPECARSAQPDPRCTSGVTAYCAGNSKVFCTQGYALDSWACTTCTASSSDTQCLGPDGKELQVKPPVRARDGG
jgi:hypothetical protein